MRRIFKNISSIYKQLNLKYSAVKYGYILGNANNKKYILDFIIKNHKILLYQPKNSEAILNIVYVLIDIGEERIARSTLNSYSKYLDRNLRIALQAHMYARLKDYKQSMELWKLLYSIDDQVEHYRATYHICNICLSTKDYNSFLIYIKYNKILSKDNCHYYEQLMSRYYYNTKQWNKSIDYCKKLIKNDFFVISSLERLIKAYLNNNETQLALMTINTYNQFDSVPKIKYYLIGRCYYNEYNFEKSIYYFEKAIEQDFNYLESIIWLAKAYYANKEFSKAKDLFDRYRDSDNIQFIGALAEAAGMLSDAENLYRSHHDITGIVNFYIKHRYWGKAYKILRDYKKNNPLNSLYEEQLRMIEELSRSIDYDINNLYESDDNIDDFMSTEYIVKKIVKMINYSSSDIIRHDKHIKKVALVIGSLGPGGAERQCCILYNELQKSVGTNCLEEVRLYVTNLSRTKRDSFYIKDINNTRFVIEYLNRNKVIDAKELKSMDKYAHIIQYIQPITRQQSIIQLAYHLEKYKPDVVHAWLDETIINTFIVCGMLNIPAAVGRWGSMPPGHSREITEVQLHNIKYLHSAYKSISELENIKFTANAKITAKAYAKWIGIPESEVEVIHNGLSFNSLIVHKSKSYMMKQCNIPKSAKIVGSVNRISEEKQPFLWVDIAKKCIEKSNNLDLYFILVGDGPLYQHVKRYIKELKVEHRVLLCGKQDNVADWYNMMDLFILTSRVEGLSNSMLEAQYLGLPVIVPDVGGLSEGLIDNKTGILLASNINVDIFSDTILNLLNNSWDIKDKERNKRFILENFSPEKMKEKTLEVYYKQLKGL